MKLWPGCPYPLGATWDGKGTNFALYSARATAVELCLFDAAGLETRYLLPEQTNYVWHGYVPDVQPGQHYGYRVRGPYDPEAGDRFNPAKLLIDPYARAIAGDVQFGPDLFSYPWAAPEKDLTISETDNAASIPKCIVTDSSFEWESDRRLEIPWHETVIYETHVKGFTRQDSDLPAAIRGTYAGLAHPAAIAHLKSLGVTAIELLPVHHFMRFPGHLVERELQNYWGYDTINFFAPYSGYSASGVDGQQVREFKQMVKALHAAGIEVILDVVYNHTAEGNHLGPTLSFKGIDNATYYWLDSKQPRYYIDVTGCGNSMNASPAQVLKLFADSLRYWVEDMHVDGFRFDLAPALARELFEVDSLAAFFDIIHQDPVLSTVKLIAEPWDLGEGGYHIGNFPTLWSEWNGKFRDTVRDFWRGKCDRLSEFALRFAGSPDMYEINGRRPHASINFITCHDGFTLADLVNYNDKHNEANGVGNEGGDSHNRSWNCGVEGETDDPEILALRQRQQRNFIATLLLAQGVPMLLGGDEMGRSQLGNNNAYCQDNELSWFDWLNRDRHADLLEFTRRVMRFRQQHPVFRRRKWFQGEDIQHGQSDSDGLRDIHWFNPDGTEVTDEQWDASAGRAIAVFLNGCAIPTPDERGDRVTDSSFLLLFNPEHEDVEFHIPTVLEEGNWQVEIATYRDDEGGPRIYSPGQPATLVSRSLTVLQQ
ncbi:MAG: glycogen debranching protein GlgX [Cyanobacteria bacterium P01_F01_bin.33]